MSDMKEGSSIDYDALYRTYKNLKLSSEEDFKPIIQMMNEDKELQKICEGDKSGVIVYCGGEAYIEYRRSENNPFKIVDTSENRAASRTLKDHALTSKNVNRFFPEDFTAEMLKNQILQYISRQMLEG